MVRTRPALPAGHGEVLATPSVAQWPVLMESNRAAVAEWAFEVAGVPATRVRLLAREAAIAAARAYSAELGVRGAHGGGEPEDAGAETRVVMTGHQPELYHPGIWVKDFLVDELARRTGSVGIDLVVDTDGFDTVGLTAPCLQPGIARCRQYLAVGTAQGCYAFTPVPAERDLDDFCRGAAAMLASLRAPAIGRHFADFCEHLHAAAPGAGNLADLVTGARRRYEAAVGTAYLELPVSRFAGEGWAHFVAQLLLDAERFRTVHNDALGEYRAAHKTRSAAQPFPDLTLDDGRVELPFWYLERPRRLPLFASVRDDRVVLATPEGEVATVAADPAAAVDEIVRGALAHRIAPRALALTMFARLFLSDLFIHGVGGGRYDRATDAVIEKYFAVAAPSFVVASMTMYLPLGAHIVTDQEVADARERLNRLTHNPDAMLPEVDFDSAEEARLAATLAAEKAALVAGIAAPDADKKTLGARIREVNRTLSELLEPVRAQLESEVAEAEAQRAASEILTDRTYPFCFWSPEEVADKVR